MFRRRSTSPDSRDASASALRSAIADSAWAAQDRAVTGLGGSFRMIADAVRWPFERVAYAAQERLIWPVEDRADTMSEPARTLSFGALVLLPPPAPPPPLILAPPPAPPPPL